MLYDVLVQFKNVNGRPNWDSFHASSSSSAPIEEQVWIRLPNYLKSAKAATKITVKPCVADRLAYGNSMCGVPR